MSIDNYYILQKERIRLQDQIKEEQNNLEELNQKVILYKKYQMIILSVRKYFTDKMKNKYEKIQNWALEYVFSDREYKFNLDITQRRNKPVVDIEIYKTQDGERRSIKLKRSGNGVKTVLQISSIFSSILLSGKEKFIFVDEIGGGISKKHQDKDYFKRMMEWIKSLIAEFDIQMIFITHDKTVQDMSDIHYYIYADSDSGYATVERT
jgi:DNA repair exonuclease SbcCD ATPase subunit